MRKSSVRTMLAATLLTNLALFAPTASQAASGQGVAYQNFTLAESLTVQVQWVNGSTSYNWGTTGLFASLNNTLGVNVGHNLGSSASFNVSEVVYQISGAAWNSTVVFGPNGSTGTWGQGATPFGGSQNLGTQFSGASPLHRDFGATINGAPVEQAAGAYSFRFDVIVTSL